MPLVTVLIPTFDHQDTIICAIDSVQNQTIQDFEIFVVGDGAPERTNDIMAKLMRQDHRIQYFPNPKDAAQGEIYRHQALQQASGKYVCYLSDDDIWLQNHLEVMLAGLADSDFAHTLHTGISPNDEVYVLNGDYASQICRQRIQTEAYKINGRTEAYTIHGLSFAGHSLAAYRTLPFGWRARPEGTPCDLYMWRQWISQDRLSFKTIPAVTCLHFDAPPRRSWTTERRVAELERWLKRSRELNFAAWLNRQILSYYQNNSIRETQLIQIVDALFKAKEFRKAAELLEEVLEKNQREWVKFKYLAEIYIENKQPGKAIEVLESALQLFPDIRHTHSFYGEVLVENDHLDKAISVFEKATQLPHTDYDDFLRLAKAQMMLGNEREAKITLQKGQMRFPGVDEFADLLLQLEIPARARGEAET